VGWRADEGRHRFTKDLDLALTQAELAAMRAWLAANAVATQELPIGGVAVRVPNATDPDDESRAIRVDFIDRSNPKHGDFADVMAAAVADARSRGQHVQVGTARFLVVSPAYLVVLKLTRIIHETSSRKLGFRSESRTRPEQRSEAHYRCAAASSEDERREARGRRACSRRSRE
jgi:hypothetical protein